MPLPLIAVADATRVYAALPRRRHIRHADFATTLLLI